MGHPQRLDFRDLYEAHFGFVWHLSRRLGVPERHLEDAAQQVFMVVHRRFKDFDPERPFKPWVAGIAVKVCADLRKRASARREIPKDDIEPSGKSPSWTGEAVERREARALVAAALERLAEPQRQVFVLHELEGWSVADLEDVLEAPLNTLYSRLRLARRAFAAAVHELRGTP
jgi:RNA polymerase sigma-70 factor (ECF subfamily)